MQIARTSIRRRQLRRWGNHDVHIGAFITYSRDKDWRPFAVVLDSGRESGCHLRLQAFGHTVLIELPRVITPWKHWVSTGHYSWAESKDAGYWDVHSREYGFSLSRDGTDGPQFLQVFLGPQTGDSTTTKSWSSFLPWTDWRHIRKSLFDDKGRHFSTEWDRRGKCLRDQWEATKAIENACPTVVFEFEDYDGQRMRATTRIVEREWRFGTKWCKWLSAFRHPRIRRSLDIDFSDEVGPEKGSWKGGTTGHGIEMHHGELHESAFRRYCEQEHRAKGARYLIKFVRRISGGE